MDWAIFDHFLDYFLDYFWTIFWTFFWTIFLDHILDHFIGGKHTVSNQGVVGCSLLVLREGWKVITQGGVREGLLLGRKRWEVDVIVNTTC